MGEVIEKTIKFVTTIRTLTDKPKVEGVYPMREWTCQVLMDDAQGKEITPPFIEKVIFKLHPTFANPNKSNSSILTGYERIFGLTTRASRQETAL